MNCLKLILIISISFVYSSPLEYEGDITDRLILDPKCGHTGSQRDLSEKIINGDQVPEGAYPWIVNIYTEKDFRFRRFCSGALITDQYVLTAAHCMDGIDYSILKIGYGSTNYETIYDNDWSRNVQKVIIHPNEKDVALLKLNSPIDLTDRSKVSTICLPFNSDTKIVYGKEVVVAGWGSTNGQKVDREKSPYLLETRLTIDEECSRSNEFYCLNPKSVNGKFSNSCYGDSGTPAMYYEQKNSKWYAYGVLSKTFTENSICQENKPSFHTKIPEFLKWINEEIKNN